jgi:nucleoid-associated protein YgaU
MAYPTRYDAAWPQADAQYNQLTAPAPAPAPVEAPVTDAPPVEIDLSDNNSNCESREGVAPRLFIFHTEEGGMQGPDFEEWMAANEVSYNFIASPDGSIIDMETDDVASWSVLDPANEFSINLCFATSTVNWSRQQWLDNMSAGIKSAAYIAVRECNKYGIPLQILVGPNYPRVRTENGITDHYAITVNQLAPGSTHVDVGPNFPWDVLNSYLQRYAAHPDAPQPQPVSPAAPVTYTVQDGDSVSGIAAQFNVTEDALLAANPSITDPNFIEAGQLLTIPPS